MSDTPSPADLGLRTPEELRQYGMQRKNRAQKAMAERRMPLSPEQQARIAALEFISKLPRQGPYQTLLHAIRDVEVVAQFVMSGKMP